MKEDRRVRRTKSALKEALLDLILERGYDRITVQDITDRADVGRSTFYSHYDSKEELLFAGFDRWVLSLAEEHHGTVRTSKGDGAGGRDDGGAPNADAAGTPKPPRFNAALPLLRHIESQPRFFLATMGRGSGTRVARRIRALIRTLMHRELERIDSQLASGESCRRPAGGPQREAQVHFLADGFLGLAQWWVENPGTMTAEEVDRVFQEIAAGAPDWTLVAEGP